MPIAVTADEARAFLRERGHDAGGLEALSGGLWSAAFAYRESGRDYVVRFHERRDDLEKDRFAERWRTASLRIPHMVEIGDMPNGGGYGIAERVMGAPIDDLDEAGMRRILPSLFAALQALRTADLSGTRGYGLWHGDGNGTADSWRKALYAGHDPEALTRDRAFLARTPVGHREFDAGIARERDLLEFASEERRVVHQDLLNYNVRADEDGVILLDWGASIYGDFLYDAALLTFWWPWYAKRWGGIDIDAEVARQFAGEPRFRERLRLCEVDIGIHHIVFQARYDRLDDAAWTARRTAELAERVL